MNTSGNYNIYLNCLSAWAGDKVSLMEDFDTICQYDVDFIEILLLFEKKFGLDLGQYSGTRKDFTSIKDFIDRAVNCAEPELV